MSLRMYFRTLNCVLLNTGSVLYHMPEFNGHDTRRNSAYNYTLGEQVQLQIKSEELRHPEKYSSTKKIFRVTENLRYAKYKANEKAADIQSDDRRYK